VRSFEKQSKPKEDIRMSFIEHSQSAPELILTLPGPHKLDALLFHEHFPQTPIIGLENHKASFEQLIRNPYPVMPYFMSIHDYAQSKHPTLHHSIVFLDYLGWFDTEKLNDIVALISNENLIHKNKQTLLGLTFSKANRDGKKAAIEAVQGVWKDHETEDSLDCIEAKIASTLVDVRPNLIGLDCKSYINNGGMPMYFILYRL
jgi:hypothetical protein